MKRKGLLPRVAALWLFASTAVALGQATNLPPLSPALPDVSASLLRMLGALVLVLALFLAGAWLFRNWQRLGVKRGHHPKLKIVEARPLGNRQALYVVGYEQQRLLVAASPAGVALLAPLPAAPESEPEAAALVAPFAQTLQQLLARK